MIALPDLRAAASRVAGSIHRPPLLSSRQLEERAGVRLHLKCESFQNTGSFKARGALNKVLSLSDEERGPGLVTVSAGNHAAAGAWAARVAGASATAALLAAKVRVSPGERVVAIVSGGNIDLEKVAGLG